MLLLALDASAKLPQLQRAAPSPPEDSEEASVNTDSEELPSSKKPRIAVDSRPKDPLLEDDELATSLCSNSVALGYKKRRQRTAPEQLRVLEQFYEQEKTPSQIMRESLATQLGMTPRRIQVWFQNKRAKDKRFAKTDEELSSVSPQANNEPIVTTVSPPTQMMTINFFSGPSYVPPTQYPVDPTKKETTIPQYRPPPKLPPFSPPSGPLPRLPPAAAVPSPAFVPPRYVPPSNILHRRHPQQEITGTETLPPIRVSVGFL